MDGDGSTRTVPENTTNNSNPVTTQNLSTAKSLKKFIKRIVPSYLHDDSSSDSEEDQIVSSNKNLPQELEISLNSHTSILTKFISDSATKTLFVEKVTVQSDSSSSEEDNAEENKAQSPVEIKTESSIR